MNIEKLPEQFTGKGEVRDFVFTLQEQSITAYLYKVDTMDATHYEVFEKRTTKKLIDFESRTYSDTELKERYPRSNDFGIWAWSVGDLNNAIVKMNNIK